MAHCEDNLKAIYDSLLQWREAHAGAFPKSLSDLAEAGGLSPWLLVCPAEGSAIGSCSYVWRGGDLGDDADGEMILAYDKTPCHKGRRNILFADGRMERHPEAKFDKLLERDNHLRTELNLKPTKE